MKEFVGEEQESDDHGEVEELAEDETVEVDVVPEQHHQQIAKEEHIEYFEIIILWILLDCQSL